MSVSFEILLIIAIAFNTLLHYTRAKREKIHQARVEELLTQSDEKKKIIEMNAEIQRESDAEFDAEWEARYAKWEEEEKDDKK